MRILPPFRLKRNETERRVLPRSILAIGVVALVLSPAGALAQLSFSTTIDLALKNSPKVRQSEAGVKRAQAGVGESVGVYRPSFDAGSSLGYSYGFPVGQPSIYNVSAHSLVFSFSQRDYIRSARTALKAAELQLKSSRQKTIEQTALDYIELSKVQKQIQALNQERDFASRLIQIEKARVEAGRDSKIELTKAQLKAAQVDLQRLQFVDRADLLRSELAHLTGMSPVDMTPNPGSIPPPPEIRPEGNYDAVILASNDSVKAAYAAAKSKMYTAFGDSRRNNRPTISFGLEYNRYAKFNNYSEYFLRFQHNNFNVGVQISIPLFDSTKEAKAADSSAAAAKAWAEADELKDQVSEQTLQTEKGLGELVAQEKVASLEQQLAQDQVDTIAVQLESSSGNSSQPPLTPKDQQEARIAERSRYVNLLDAKFQVTQAELNLLRSLGKIEEWAKSAPSDAIAPAAKPTE